MKDKIVENIKARILSEYRKHKLMQPKGEWAKVAAAKIYSENIAHLYSAGEEVFPTWEDAMSGITDHRITRDDYKHMASSGARIMYDRLYSMLHKKLTRPTVSDEEIEEEILNCAAGTWDNNGTLRADEVDVKGLISAIKDRLNLDY